MNLAGENNPEQNLEKYSIKAIADELPWPQGLDGQAKQNIETFLHEGQSLCVGIARQVDIDGQYLLAMFDLKFKEMRSKSSENQEEFKKEEEDLYVKAGELVTGYQEVLWEIEYAKKLEKSPGGDIAQHPDYDKLQKIGQTSSGTQELKSDDAVEETRQLLRDKRMFDLIKTDPSGRSLLDFVLESKKQSLRRKGLSPLNQPSVIGLRHGVERYKEMYSHFANANRE